MPDLDLIIQAEQAGVRLPRQVNLSLLHNSDVPGQAGVGASGCSKAALRKSAHKAGGMG